MTPLRAYTETTHRGSSNKVSCSHFLTPCWPVAGNSEMGRLLWDCQESSRRLQVTRGARARGRLVDTMPRYREARLRPLLRPTRRRVALTDNGSPRFHTASVGSVRQLVCDRPSGKRRWRLWVESV